MCVWGGGNDLGGFLQKITEAPIKTRLSNKKFSMLRKGKSRD